MERWKERNYIKFKNSSRDAPPAVIKDYEAKDIFNDDETRLYSRVIPEGTLSFKISRTAACKMAKERITLLFPCNMDGSEKLKPLIIGKSKNPPCLKNVKTLPVDYEANKNSYMRRLFGRLR
ncbi:Tigger transposable element-derived protein 6 [Thelohanellus kitauei]|uniref:Tigger transposable element-derived protein 6 n=1 Tax=Thelohanellus kitauei TaxID=669202 RepID=A0A0C2MF54_THEKT|nr:Tigger transposable element-derived protein 6 [Thelohanellus kitauei]